ncbi:MAG: serine/threonine protein kinase [Myxococcaceae bacterium]|nr:serine/threonine protein kinase [Myxococcaceae bacterium]
MPFTPDEWTGKRFGRYEVVCRLAVGGSAEIFLGTARTGPFVGLSLVLKRMLAPKNDQEALQDLIDEAKITATLSHPNIARIYDIAVTKDDVVLVMEFIPGATLSEIRRARRRSMERVPLGFTFKAIGDALLGLHHAHLHQDAKGRPRPVVHRDVTPGNLMLDFAGNCRLLDFGIARVTGASRRTRTDFVRGTAAYMSPEQIRAEPLDYRSDLFSLGAVLHELLTGDVAFGRATDAEELEAVLDAQIQPPSAHVPSLPGWLDELVMKALQPKPGARYPTAEKMRDALLEGAGDEVWSTLQCANYLRLDFAEREGRIENLMREIRLTDEPTIPAGAVRMRRNSVSEISMPNALRHKTGSTKKKL